MKKSGLILFLFMFFSCNKELEQSRIQGHIDGLSTDTLYLYGVEDLYDRVDTVFLEGGKFSIDLPIDTLTLLRMVVRDSLEYPLFIGKKEELIVSGSINGLLDLDVESKNGLNEEFVFFQDSIRHSSSNFTDSLFLNKTKQYILDHNNSLISVYLLDTYFVNVPNPNFDEIKYIIDRLSGELKDRHSIASLLDRLEELQKVEVSKIAPYFTLKMADGKSKTRSSFKDKYLLLHFWASWDKKSREQNKVLKELYKENKKQKKLSLVSFSLDLDSVSWKNAIREDSLVWDQACDLRAWSSEFVKLFSIYKIPTLILINPQSKIIDREIDVNDLTEQLDSLLKE
ncbi:MAG: AhpC/TSA family protein [Bacteroidales bacterium]|mgnify:CR=1 FL=1|nr:AhpC/TSA family protein [Bacteroidales bacterium]